MQVTRRHCAGEYVKDLDWAVLAQDPVLASKVPRPLVEKGHCQGIWAPLENTWYEAAEDYTTFRDCWDYDPPDHLQPLSRYSSKVRCRYLDNISISNFLGA